MQGGEDEGVTERVELPGRWWAGVDAPQIRASSGKTVDTPAEECSPAAPWVTPSDLAAHAVRRCCQGNVGGAQSRSEETARSQGAAGARRKTEGKWPPHTASGGPPADACGVALRATGPFSVRCTTASLKRAPAGAGRSRDRLKSRPQLLRGVRMAGLERLLARCPHPDAAAISRVRSFAAFAERRRWVGPNHGKFLFTRTPARAEPKVLRGAARRPPRRFARYASLTAGAGAWRRRCAKRI